MVTITHTLLMQGYYQWWIILRFSGTRASWVWALRSLAYRLVELDRTGDKRTLGGLSVGRNDTGCCRNLQPRFRSANLPGLPSDGADLNNSHLHKRYAYQVDRYV
jgi:hypothetical protein